MLQTDILERGSWELWKMIQRKRNTAIVDIMTSSPVLPPGELV